MVEIEKDQAIVLTGPINKSQIPQATIPIIICINIDVVL